MDAFDEMIFNELIEKYSYPELSDDDLGELYFRFSCLEHIKEVRAYLWTMRFFGWGTQAQPNEVIKEMLNKKDDLSNDELGLYYDLLLENEDDTKFFLEKFCNTINNGYTSKFTKERSHIDECVNFFEQKNEQEMDYQDENNEDIEDDDDVEEELKIVKILFESKKLFGTKFTSCDVDYIHAVVYFKPLKKPKKIKIRSQIFNNDEQYSSVFENVYDLRPGCDQFATTGWGSKQGNSYHEGKYKWVIEVDGKKLYNNTFYVYSGAIQRPTHLLLDARIYSVCPKGIKVSDKYIPAFSVEQNQKLYVKVFIKEPGIKKIIQNFVKVVNLEDNSVVYNTYFLQKVNEDTFAYWYALNSTTPWKQGLYKYTVHWGAGNPVEGTFSIMQ